MNNRDQTTLDPRLQAWIDEGEADSGHETLGANERDGELLSLLRAIPRATEEMSQEEIDGALAIVRRRLAEPSQPTRRDAWLAVAAVAAGFAVGLTVMPRGEVQNQAAGPSAGAAPIKKVFFESIHEGKTVRFELELSRTR